MKISAPKKSTWWVATIVGFLGIIGHFIPITNVSANSWWLVVIGFIVLFLGTVLKGF